MTTITALIENTVSRGGLAAEHGLSLLVETDGQRILFDTGQGPNFYANAKNLGHDLSRVDAVVLSHGHYDHAGGLETFCRANSRAPIYAKPDLFRPKYHGAGRFIGVPDRPDLFGSRIRFVNGTTEIAPDFFLVPDIPLKYPHDAHLDGFTVRDGDAGRPDDFSDELFAAVVADGNLSVISGCSHRGITNILAAARARFTEPLDLVLGGFHLGGDTDAKALQTLNKLKSFRPRRIGVCHCTGVEKYPLVKKVFGDRAFYFQTGQSVKVSG